MGENDLRFKVSAALKDIIGKDLITDDYIAVFELVKNAFDAYATRVDIYFHDIHTANGKIIIKDNGKGMNYDDLVNKWLFVAYSAKKDGTEDDGFDYRDMIHSNRPFAGAKGIGRFSCDRLGRHLYLETRKKEKHVVTQALITDWEKFEADVQDEFIDITVLHEEKKNGGSYGLEHGTVLEITGLRSGWDRDKLLHLKDSLAKLINPNRGKEEQVFKIFIHAPEEGENDEGQKEYYKIVNGEVKNFIFEALGLKTTKIQVSISGKDKSKKSYITTTLVDGGTTIYEAKEENDFDHLWDIDITLYYLNMSAKLTFARRMGIASKRYGHVFLYKNGFRIYPFGEPFEDPLKMDVRKSRRRNIRIGTGEVMGQIEIFGNNPELKETSSRGDGLIKNSSYYELVAFFEKVVERLEKYVVEVQQWGLSIENDTNDVDLNDRVTNLIAQLTGSDKIVEFKAPNNLTEILDQSQSNSAGAVITNLKKIAATSHDERLMALAGQAGAKLAQAHAARIEAEKEADEERRNLERVRRDLDERVTENLFLKSIKSQDLDEVVSFMHAIGISATTIDNYLGGIYKKMNKGIAIGAAELKRAIEAVSFENKKILTITRFSTKANFKLYAEDASLDIIGFIKEYVHNILKPLRAEDIIIAVTDIVQKGFVRTFKPIELSILLDNFLSNSIRAKAKHFDIVFSESRNGGLEITFADDGKGIPDQDLDKIFGFGFTTTSGSGLGLFHVMEIVKKMGGKLVVDNKRTKGVRFILTLN